MLRRMGGVLIGIVMLITLITGCKPQQQARKNNDKQKVEITYWHRMTGEYEDELNKLVKAFNQSQDKYVVKPTSQGSYDALQQKIMAAAKSKNLPTISQTPYTNIGDYVERDLLLPLDDYMLRGKDKLTNNDRNDIYSNFLSSSKYDGKYYTIPFSKSDRVLFYNKDLMAKYHIEQPKTWEDFQTVAQKLQGSEVAVLTLDKSYEMELEGLAYSAGTPLISTDLTPNLTAKTTLEAGNLITGYIRSGVIKTAGEDNYFGTLFAQNKSVFGIGSSATIAVLKSQAPSELHWDTAEVPTYHGVTSSALAGNDIALFKGATKAQQQGAWQFMKFLMSEKATAEWSMATGYLPVRQSAVNDKDFQAYLEEHPEFKGAIVASKHSFPSPVFAGYAEYRSDLLDAVESTVDSHQPFETAFSKLQQQTEELIQPKKIN